MAAIRVLILLAGLALIHAAKLDDTLRDGASGSKVVEAVVDRIEAACIFPEDKMFMRRVAYVESQDGMEDATYAPRYNGGIWRVSDAHLCIVSVNNFFQNKKQITF